MRKEVTLGSTGQASDPSVNLTGNNINPELLTRTMDVLKTKT